MPSNNDARRSAEFYMRQAYGDSDNGSDLERLNLSMAQVTAVLALTDQMARIADALEKIADNPR